MNAGGPQDDDPPIPQRPDDAAQRMEPPPAGSGLSGVGRFIVVLLLLFAVGGFGLVTLCGAVFTVAGLGGGEYMGGALVMAVPSLLIGGGLCWLCLRALIKLLRGRSGAVQ
jgi:hypothetical protein